MKLPDKKYEPRHCKTLAEYAQGWNITIKNAEFRCNEYSDEIVKESLLEDKEMASDREETPYFKGIYDCVVEIEKLNTEETKSKDVFNDMFSDSLEALDKLNMNIQPKKSILVIDEPKVCGECALFKNYYDNEYEECYYACAFTEQVIDSDEAEEHRHKDCPLKELPPRQST